MTEEVRRLIRENIEVFKPRLEVLVRICAWCGRWYDGKAWLRAPIPKGRRTHGICESCYDKLQAGKVYDEVTKTWKEN